MAEKLLKARKQKVAHAVGRSPRDDTSVGRSPRDDTSVGRSPRDRHPAPQGIVLVGTYRERQLAWIKRNGVYNYPVKDGDTFDAAAFGKIRELWLYAGTKGKRHCFAAEFVGKMSRDAFLAAYPTYAKLSRSVSPPAPQDPADGRGRSPSAPHAAYYVFKTTFLDYGPRIEDPLVVARGADFGGRSVKVRKAIEAFRNGGEFGSLADFLPSDLSAVPRQQLRVCEAAVQMEFMRELDRLTTMRMKGNSASSHDGRLTCLDFFAGSGLVSKGLSQDFRTVWANDISSKKALVFNANNESGILQVCPIENIAGHALPLVEMSWGSFPCQDLSLAGDIKGLYASRSGLFWQWLRVMDEMPIMPPVAVAENVVGLVSADGGRYYVAAHEELSRRGYRVGAVMLDAVNWLPQSRKRIFIVGVRKDIDLTGLTTDAPIWCHSAPLIKVSSMVKDWVWWNMPRPQMSQTTIEQIIDFKNPCDDEKECAYKLSLVSEGKINEIRNLSSGCIKAFTGYRRTRNHRQVLEVRTDGVAGCLRTPCGGSSRQIVVIANNGILSTRLLTVRETARLMGAPESYRIPGSYNDGYMAMGDAVAVPVVKYLSGQLLAPLAERARAKGDRNECCNA